VLSDGRRTETVSRSLDLPSAGGWSVRLPGAIERSAAPDSTTGVRAHDVEATTSATAAQQAPVWDGEPRSSLMANPSSRSA
jgi:hypothetical protein